MRRFDPNGAGMNARPGNEYLRNAVLTATPEQLQLLLYDGAIRFSSQAREAMLAKDIEQTHNLLTRAQRILIEMQGGLRPEIAPDLCQQMASLYNFVYRRLVDANVNKDAEALDEAIQILGHMRETWVLLMNRLQEEKAGPVPAASASRPQQMDPMGVASGGFIAEG